MSALAPEYILARRTLLDALDALEGQRRSLVLVGAQAIYLRVGDAGLQVAPFTTDSDLGISPELLAAEPELAAALEGAGFSPATEDSVGIWVAVREVLGIPAEVKVDLLVPEAVGGEGRRAARIPPHGARVARKVRGLEGALFDHDPMTLGSLEDSDPRSHELRVAGPAALLVAKAHKIMERLAERRGSTTVAKDALDVVRLLRGSEEGDVARRLRDLLEGYPEGDAVRRATAAVAREGWEFVRREFGVTAGRGCDLAVAAGAGSIEEGELRASTVDLVGRLEARLGALSGE